MTIKIENKKILRTGILTLAIWLLNHNLAEAATWRFAVMSDTHVGVSDTAAEMIPFVLADSVDLVLVSGDIADAGKACTPAKLRTQLTQWKSVFAPLYNNGVAVYPIRGNHEADAQKNISVWNDFFSGADTLPQNGPDGEKNLTYSFNHKNAFFVGLDNYVNIHTVNQPWLDQQLAENTRPHVFVFGHEAAFKVFHADCLDDSVAKRNAFWESLANHNVKTYFCGHDHFIDVSRIDNGDGNINNDVYQYLVGASGGWLMSKYNYNGANSPYWPKSLFHDAEHGYALVEVSGDEATDYNITITWKKRTVNPLTSDVEYLATPQVIKYAASPHTAIIKVPEAKVAKLTIEPNPAGSAFTINGTGGKTDIYNNPGTRIWSGYINGTETLSTANFANGIYLVVQATGSAKLIIKH